MGLINMNACINSGNNVAAGIFV